MTHHSNPSVIQPLSQLISQRVMVSAPRAEAMVLRLSITDRCNFRCRYCLPSGMQNWVPSSNLPSLETLVEAVRWLMQIFPISKIKLTGGEPLVRKGIVPLIHDLQTLPGVEDLSMTTNGSLLAHYAVALKRAGLHRLNVSLDTLDPGRFHCLTGQSLHETLAGIAAAQAAGFKRTKLNAVLQRSTWQTDVPRLLDFAVEHGYEIRFIELMNTSEAAGWTRAEFIAASEIYDWLRRQTLIYSLPDQSIASARRCQTLWRGRDLTVGWITPQTERFCTGCQRLRLDCHGRLRRCLMDFSSYPLVQSLATETAEEVKSQVLEYLLSKQPPLTMSTPQPMVALGG